MKDSAATHPEEKFNPLRIDIQAALTIVGRSNSQSKFEVNFQGCNLQLANLRGLNLANADFRKADLSGASLVGENLEGTYLSLANLSYAHLFDANLTEAFMLFTILESTDFEAAICDFMGAGDTDLSRCINLKQKQLYCMLGDADTKIPKKLMRPKNWSDIHFSDGGFREVWREHIAKFPS